MSELKPCPFCGGNAQAYAETRMHHAVGCMICNAELVQPGSMDSAIDAWNRRAIPADQVLVPSELLAELLEAAKDGAAHKGEYLSKKYGEPELFAKFDTILHP